MIRRRLDDRILASRRTTSLGLVVAALAFGACTTTGASPSPSASPAMSEPATSPAMSEPATSPAATVGTGRLHAVDGTASGTVSLLHLADGSFEVSFEYLSVASAAHTDVILVTNVDVLKTSEIDRKAILDLGSLKGTSGMQEYPIPASASSASMRFHTVVLWETEMGLAVAAAPLK